MELKIAIAAHCGVGVFCGDYDPIQLNKFSMFKKINEYRPAHALGTLSQQKKGIRDCIAGIIGKHGHAVIFIGKEGPSAFPTGKVLRYSGFLATNMSGLSGFDAIHFAHIQAELHGVEANCFVPDLWRLFDEMAPAERIAEDLAYSWREYFGDNFAASHLWFFRKGFPARNLASQKNFNIIKSAHDDLTSRAEAIGVKFQQVVWLALLDNFLKPSWPRLTRKHLDAAFNRLAELTLQSNRQAAARDWAEDMLQTGLQKLRDRHQKLQFKRAGARLQQRLAADLE